MEIRVPQHLGPFSPSCWPGQVYGREGRCGPQPVQGGGWVSVSGPAASFQSPRAERERAERRQLPVPSELSRTGGVRSVTSYWTPVTTPASESDQWQRQASVEISGERGQHQRCRHLQAPGHPSQRSRWAEVSWSVASGQGELWGQSWAIWGHSTTLQSTLTIHWGL